MLDDLVQLCLQEECAILLQRAVRRSSLLTAGFVVL
jgi:hypothetical protein